MSSRGRDARVSQSSFSWMVDWCNASCGTHRMLTLRRLHRRLANFRRCQRGKLGQLRIETRTTRTNSHLVHRLVKLPEPCHTPSSLRSVSPADVLFHFAPLTLVTSPTGKYPQQTYLQLLNTSAYMSLSTLLSSLRADRPFPSLQFATSSSFALQRSYPIHIR